MLVRACSHYAERNGRYHRPPQHEGPGIGRPDGVGWRSMSPGLWVLAGVAVVLGLVVLYDVTQKRHAIIHNFPIVGHFRYLLETVGPELRQYIVTGNDEERPFSRDQRRWVYASSKKENNYFGFGTDNDLERDGYIIIRHTAFPIHTPRAGEPGHDPKWSLPAYRVLGAVRGRKHAF